MKKLLLTVLFLVTCLVVVIVIKTLSFRSQQIDAEPAIHPVFRSESLKNLSTAIRFPTISHGTDLPVDTSVFRGFHQFLADTYPLVHTTLKKEVISELSLLYTWEGSNISLKPVVLTAHMDVVPAMEENLWEKEPFSGENDGTCIWGRGTLDDKNSIIALLEAVEHLISENFRPERSLYLAFGHDEEIGGYRGAGRMAVYLKDKGVVADFLLDEGLAVTKGMVPMVDQPVALIGTSEKGYLSVNLSVEMEGGHAMAPEKETAVTVLNTALYKVINNQMKANIPGPVNDFIRHVGPEMPFYAKAVFANKWLFKGVIIKLYQRGGSTNAAVRTTTAPTVLRAGIMDNVVPVIAEAVINFRILPGETSGDVIQHLQRVISDDRVNISVMKVIEPSPVSPVNTDGFRTISATIRQVYPEVIVSPMLVLGQTDSRHYTGISKNIYRFSPIIVTPEDMVRIHGINEKIRIDDFLRSISFYYQLMQNI